MSGSLEDYTRAHAKLETERSEWKGFIGGLRNAVASLAQSPQPYTIAIADWPAWSDIEARTSRLQDAEETARKTYDAIPDAQRSMVKAPKQMHANDSDISDIFENLFGNRPNRGG